MYYTICGRWSLAEVSSLDLYTGMIKLVHHSLGRLCFLRHEENKKCKGLNRKLTQCGILKLKVQCYQFQQLWWDSEKIVP